MDFETLRALGFVHNALKGLRDSIEQYGSAVQDFAAGVGQPEIAAIAAQLVEDVVPVRGDIQDLKAFLVQHGAPPE